MELSPENLMERGDAARYGSTSTTTTAAASTSAATTTVVDSGTACTVSEQDPESQLNTCRWLRFMQKPFKKRNSQQIQESKPSTQPRNTSVRSLYDCPEGYPRLAALLDSDENFMMYRRFGFLQARLLLYKQDELRMLEYRLDLMDREDHLQDPSILKGRNTRDLKTDTRRALIAEIDQKFAEYAQLLKTARDMASFNRPPDRDYNSVKCYFSQFSPVWNDEAYIYHVDDIVTLKPVREATILDGIVEKLLGKYSGTRLVQRIFCDPQLTEKMKTRQSGVTLYRTERIDLVISLIITTFVLGLLITPVCILLALTRTPTSIFSMSMMILVLLVFTLVFTTVMNTFTKAKRHEVLAAAAAYCAVLVVFMGNLGQISMPGPGK